MLQPKPFSVKQLVPGGNQHEGFSSDSCLQKSGTTKAPLQAETSFPEFSVDAFTTRLRGKDSA